MEYRIAYYMEETEAVREWLPLVTSAMELPATHLFLKLREGQLEALGKLLPDGAAIIDFVEDDNSYGRSRFDDLVDQPIPHNIWKQSGIDWLANAATTNGNSYCDVSVSVEVLMRLFPGERTAAGDAEFVGNSVLVKPKGGSEKAD